MGAYLCTMERSFYEYVFFFLHEANDYALLANIVAHDPHFPKGESKENMYKYASESFLYRGHKHILIELYTRYLRALKGDRLNAFF